MHYAPTLHRVPRRPFDLGPVPFVGGLAGLALVLAIVLFALGSWVAGIVLLVLTLVLIALPGVALERDPEAETARLAAVAADRARSWVSFGGHPGRA